MGQRRRDAKKDVFETNIVPDKPSVSTRHPPIASAWRIGNGPDLATQLRNTQRKLKEALAATAPARTTAAVEPAMGVNDVTDKAELGYPIEELRALISIATTSSAVVLAAAAALHHTSDVYTAAAVVV